MKFPVFQCNGASAEGWGWDVAGGSGKEAEENRQGVLVVSFTLCTCF